MISEAIDAIADLQRRIAEAEKTRRVDTSADGRTETWYHNGELLRVTATPPNRKHHVTTVDDLIAVATRDSEGKGNIWIGDEEVVFIFDDADRRDRVTLRLLHSSTWAFLLTLVSNSNGFEHDDFIRVLRTKLRNATNQPAILASVRKIKFRSLAAGHSNIQHGNESMGQQIENEVSGGEDIPDALVIDTNVYSNLGEREQVWPVALDLEIIAKARKFKLTPQGDEIERVGQAALASIRDRIVKGVQIPVYYGTP